MLVQHEPLHHQFTMDNSPSSVFNAAPRQTERLVAMNIFPPAALTDEGIRDPLLKRQRFEEARRYRHGLRIESAAREDHLEADRYLITAGIALAIEDIQRNIAPVDAQAVKNLIMSLINARLDQINARLENALARHPLNPITPLFALPVILLDGQSVREAPPLPSVFPQTRGELFRLTADECDVFSGYYDINLAAELARFLGVPPLI